MGEKSVRACDGGACDAFRMETYFHCDGIPSERVGWIPRSGIRARAVPETSFSTGSRHYCSAVGACVPTYLAERKETASATARSVSAVRQMSVITLAELRELQAGEKIGIGPHTTASSRSVKFLSWISFPVFMS